MRANAIQTVRCLVRAKDDQDAQRRKIHALHTDLSDPQLGLDSKTYQSVTKNLRSVIHCPWSVNFNLSLSSFKKDCIAGMRHLIDLCLAVPGSKPASFDFCSSSKCVAEHICMAASKATGMRARILRVGQIVAGTTRGVWNDTEVIPLIIKSALTIGVLPKLQQSPSWTPVDVVAQAVIEITLSDAESIVANVTNAKTFSWTKDLLPALMEAGFEFEEVGPKEWVRRLAASSDDVVVNPPKKLLDFFASKYDKHIFAPSRTYETGVATSLSPALANAPIFNADFVKTFVQQFQRTAWKRS
ncbi:hypothetical protein HBH89_050760 [Parastagonospora nodorum]|nr:hypothetical protein HBH89_050760 [Parastagonospora nodorum]